ncbi:MAG: hypothetical protein H6R20_1074 [Proteobacteria bacterium]|nr:hypothetical protein [Pseudomonadota bacterium]
MHALAGERVQIHGERRDERLAFAGAHFGDLAVVQDDPADQLHVEVPHVQRALGRFADHREGLGQELVEGRAVRVALPEFLGLCAQRVVRQRLDGRLERVDLRDRLPVLLQQPIVARAENGLENVGNHRGMEAKVKPRILACGPLRFSRAGAVRP